VTPEMLLVLAVLAGAIVLFVTEVVRIDVAAILVMVVIGLLGLVPTGDIFAGFASNAVISIIAVMILGAALDRVGVMRQVAALLLRIAGSSERRIIASSATAVGGLSAFMQNIGAAALFLPVMERIGERTGTATRRLLMPMGFAAILGGTLTLVASGPLILLNDLLASSAEGLDTDIAPYGLFAPTPVGLALLVSGIVLFAFAGRWLLPSSDDEVGTSTTTLADLTSRYGLDGHLRIFEVPADSPLVARSVEDIERSSSGVLLTAISADDETSLAPPRETQVGAGDVLGMTGDDEAVEAFAHEHGLHAGPEDVFDVLRDDAHAGLVEVVVRPGGDADGAIVRDLRLRARFGLTLLGIHQRGELLADGLRERRVHGGDVLVLFGPWDAVARLDEVPSLVAISDHPTEPPRTGKRWWALGSFTLALVLVLATELQLSLALMVGAVGVLLSGVLTADEAYRAVSWKTVFLLAALIPLGQAVEDSGTAAWIAEGVVGATSGLPVWAILLTVGVLGTLFTLVVSNVGATVLLVPLAVNVAVGVGADPAMFGLMVAIAASNAFVLPTHQVNALLMGPGGYRVKDYVRAGSVMSVLFLVVATPMVLLVG
jgi:di/tricarboxylate transporter